MSAQHGGRSRPQINPDLERGRISRGQLFAVLFLAVFPTMAMLLPGDLVRLGGRYGWWTPLLAAATAVPAAWLAGALGGRVGDSVSAVMRGFGPAAGRALLLVEWLALGAYVVVTIREAGEISAVTLVTAHIPVWVLTVLGALPAAILAWLGPVVLGRAATLIWPVLVFMYAGVLGAMLPSTHIIWALPLLPRNARFAAWQPVLRTWVWEAEPLFLGAGLMHRVRSAGRRTAGGTLALAVAVSALLTTVGTWSMVATAGPRGVAVAAFPALDLVNRIAFGPFVQHLQSVVLPIETMGTVIKEGVFLWFWARLGRRLAGGWTGAVLAVETVVGTSLAVASFPNLLALDRATHLLLARWALPILVGGTLVAYAAALIPRGGRRT